MKDLKILVMKAVVQLSSAMPAAPPPGRKGVSGNVILLDPVVDFFIEKELLDCKIVKL